MRLLRFLLDENVDYRLASFLTQLGHQVTVISYDYPYGIEDQHILALAFQERRILLTNEKDFGELIFLQNLPHQGVILFRLKPKEVTIPIMQERLVRVLSHYKNHLEFISKPHEVHI